MASETLDPPSPPVGVVESLARGFETTASQLALLILPIVIDLFIWLGPRVLFEYNYQELWAVSAAISNPSTESRAPGQPPTFALAPEETEPTPRYLPVIGVPTVLGERRIPFGSYLPVWAIETTGSLFGMALLMLFFGTPWLLGGREAHTLPFTYDPSIWTVDSWVGLLGITLAFVLTGFLLSILYMTLIAHQVGDGALKWGSILRKLPFVLANAAILNLIMFGVLLVVLMPFALFAAMARSFVVDVGSVIMSIGYVFAIWLGLFGIFTLPGILMNQRSVFGAIWDSVRVVQWNITPTLLLLLIVLVLSWSMRMIFLLPDPNSWIVLAAIGAHAFAATSLIATVFVFFKDRYRYWREMRAYLIARLTKERASKNA